MKPITDNGRHDLPLTILGVLALMAFIVAYLPVIRMLGFLWSDSDEYTHAFLVFPIILYMVWAKREQLERADRLSMILGIFSLIVSMPVYFFALLANVNTLKSLSMLLAIVGTITYLFGIRAPKILIMPLFLFVLLIPIPDRLYIQLTFPLQLKVSQISEALIQLLDIPIYREGNIMSLPGKRFEVVEACSGMRSIMTLLTLSIVIGYFRIRKATSKLILALCSIPIAIVINLIRVISMLLMFYYFNIDLSAGTLHTVAGILIFCVALFFLFSLERILGAKNNES